MKVLWLLWQVMHRAGGRWLLGATMRSHDTSKVAQEAAGYALQCLESNPRLATPEKARRPSNKWVASEEVRMSAAF